MRTGNNETFAENTAGHQQATSARVTHQLLDAESAARAHLKRRNSKTRHNIGYGRARYEMHIAAVDDRLTHGTKQR